MKEYGFYSFLSGTSVACVGHSIDFVLCARLGGKFRKRVMLFRAVKYFLIIEFLNICFCVLPYL